MKKLIKSILFGAIVPLLYFTVVWYKGIFKSGLNQVVIGNVATIIILWILFSVLVHMFSFDDNQKQKNIKTNSG